VSSFGDGAVTEVPQNVAKQAVNSVASLWLPMRIRQSYVRRQPRKP